MALEPIPCPFTANEMVIVLQIALCGETGDDALGQAVMEVLTPDQRLRTFDAIRWYRANPQWDRISYAESAIAVADSLQTMISRWEEYPNALGSEAQAAVLVGRVAAALGEEVPGGVQAALKTLALRGTMRDIASAIGQEDARHSHLSFHDVVNTGAAASGLSWTEALAVIARYCHDSLARQS